MKWLEQKRLEKRLQKQKIEKTALCSEIEGLISSVKPLAKKFEASQATFWKYVEHHNLMQRVDEDLKGLFLEAGHCTKKLDNKFYTLLACKNLDKLKKDLAFEYNVEDTLSSKFFQYDHRSDRLLTNCPKTVEVKKANGKGKWELVEKVGHKKVRLVIKNRTGLQAAIPVFEEMMQEDWKTVLVEAKLFLQGAKNTFEKALEETALQTALWECKANGEETNKDLQRLDRKFQLYAQLQSEI